VFLPQIDSTQYSKHNRRFFPKLISSQLISSQNPNRFFPKLILLLIIHSPRTVNNGRFSSVSTFIRFVVLTVICRYNVCIIEILICLILLCFCVLLDRFCLVYFTIWSLKLEFTLIGNEYGA
jgi:hypothetical protein